MRLKEVLMLLSEDLVCLCDWSYLCVNGREWQE